MKIIITLLGLLLLTGCSTTGNWTATGGSRADGVIRLSYEEGSLVSTKVEDQQAVDIATQRCKSWGYTNAEAFGGTTRECNAPGVMGGCGSYLVTKEFQCIGNPTPAE